MAIRDLFIDNRSNVSFNNLDGRFNNNNLYVYYDAFGIINKLRYDYFGTDVIKADLKLKEENGKYIKYWDITLNSHKDPEFSIVTNYITMDAINRLVDHKDSSSFMVNHISYKNADSVNSLERKFCITIPIKEDKTELELEFDYGVIVTKETSDYYTILKVRQDSTGELLQIHYIDKHIYHITDYKENSETIYLEDYNIKYEFDKKDLSTSDYILYHQPYRVTDYTNNKQYIIKYDEYGIMNSLLDISEPEVNLCIYKVNKSSLNEVEILSLHPDIYNTFDRFALTTYMMEDTLVLERYTRPKKITKEATYIRNTISKKSVVRA